MTTTFPHLPTSILAVERGQSAARYIRTPASSLDWPGADWDHPISLDFKTEVMTASTLGVDMVLDSEPIPPAALVRELQDMWHRAGGHLKNATRVVDADDPQGVVFHPDLTPGRTVIRLRLKTWPAIPGATIPKKATTL
jgi:hypothetical protein